MSNRKFLLAGVSALALIAYSGAAAAEGTSNGNGDTGADVFGESVVSGNKVIDWMSRRANDIGGVDGAGSFTDGASGVVHVQQNNGSANGLENGTAIQGGLIDHLGSVKSVAGLNLQTFDNKSIVKGADDIQDEGQPFIPPTIVKAINPDTGELEDVVTDPGQPFIAPTLKDFNDRENTIGSESFGGFSGVASIQQNNGDANQIGISTAILSIIGVQEGDGHHGAEVTGSTFNQTGKGALAKDPEWNGSPGTPEIPPDMEPLLDSETGEPVLDEETGEPIMVEVEGTGSPAIPAVPGAFAAAVLDEDSDVLNSVANAFNGASGIFQVQQNNGNGNAIGSATAVVSTGSFWGTLSGGVKVGGTTMDNAVVDVNVNRVNTIENAFTGASGSATVQQNNGHSNFLGAATSIVYGTSESGAALAGGLTNASLGNMVTNNAVQVDQSDHYSNSVAMAFNGFAGIAQVQQNNGNANGLASAVHVSVQTGNPASPPLPFGNGGSVPTP